MMCWEEFDMLQNQIIVEKLEEKTEGDKHMREFINALVDKELAGGQFTKVYEKLIEKYAKGE